MKKIMIFTGLVFLVVIGSFQIFLFASDYVLMQPYHLNQGILSVEKVDQTDAMIVPLNVLPKENETHTLSYHYQITVEDGYALEVKHDLEESIIELFNLEEKIVYNASSDCFDVYLDLSLNPSSREETALLMGTSLSITFDFNAVKK